MAITTINVNDAFPLDPAAQGMEFLGLDANGDEKRQSLASYETTANVDKKIAAEKDRAEKVERGIDERLTTAESKQQEDGAKIDSLDKEMGTVKGDVTELKKQTATKLSYVELQVGNSAEIKQANLAALRVQNGQFFVKINYAFGVGTFNTSNGGFISTTNAYDNDVYYTIAADGSIAKKDDYIAPNEPYSVHLTQEQVGVQLTEIEGSKVAKAGELIIVGSTGMITYTRTSDSTASAVYFTDDNKDGSTTLLTYNSSNRTIQSTRISKEPEGGYLRPLFEAITGVKYNPTTKLYEIYKDRGGLTDITEEEMMRIYNAGSIWSSGRFGDFSGRTVLYDTTVRQFDAGQDLSWLFYRAVNLQVVILPNYGIKPTNIVNMFTRCRRLRTIKGELASRDFISLDRITKTLPGGPFVECYDLEYVLIKYCKINLSFKDSRNLSVDDYTESTPDSDLSTLGFLIKYASNTEAITIELHPTAFDKVPQGLKDKAIAKNITLNKAL